MPGLLPRSMQVFPGPGGSVDRLVCLDGQGHPGVWTPVGTANNQTAQHVGADLRQLAADPVLRTTPLDDGSRVQLADVDGDGVVDLVLLLRFQQASPGAADALLVLMRGKAVPAPNEMPFQEPTVATAVHGRATSFALGDFAPTVPGVPRRLELALAVPESSSSGSLDGDHVRFYRYVPGATPELDRFVPSAVAGMTQVLAAGPRPTRLAAADFDRDGLDDLLVAVAGDSSLRQFRNTALPSLQPAEVEVDAFLEISASRRALVPGMPTELRLGDVNGDGAIDAFAAVESQSGGVRNTAVAFYLSTEPGVFGEAVGVSPTRLGNRNASMVLDLGDWNKDGVLDLFIGWNTSISQDRNVRALLGGSR
ncbi:MAG: VCBS repeat-containing protein [Planctomycetota bacterium]